jgi:hypothetical protein
MKTTAKYAKHVTFSSHSNYFLKSQDYKKVGISKRIDSENVIVYDVDTKEEIETTLNDLYELRVFSEDGDVGTLGGSATWVRDGDTVEINSIERYPAVMKKYLDVFDIVYFRDNIDGDMIVLKGEISKVNLIDGEDTFNWLDKIEISNITLHHSFKNMEYDLPKTFILDRQDCMPEIEDVVSIKCPCCGSGTVI